MFLANELWDPVSSLNPPRQANGDGLEWRRTCWTDCDECIMATPSHLTLHRSKSDPVTYLSQLWQQGEPFMRFPHSMAALAFLTSSKFKVIVKKLAGSVCTVFQNRIPSGHPQCSDCSSQKTRADLRWVAIVKALEVGLESD